MTKLQPGAKTQLAQKKCNEWEQYSEQIVTNLAKITNQEEISDDLTVQYDIL